MAKYPSIKELLDLNPHIDEEKLAEAMEILRKLRDSKARKSGPNPIPPFLRRPILIGERDKIDSRTVLLKRLAH